MMTSLATWCMLSVVLVTLVTCAKFGDVSLEYEWSVLDMTWTSQTDRDEFIKNGSFVPDKNLLGGLKVYKNQVYAAVPRWRSLTGIPVTLAKVVKGSGSSRLSPYPDWTWQTMTDCHRLQYVQSMEIDPNTGLMYVLDTGRVGLGSPHVTPSDLCPAKIVIFDLNTDTHVASHELTSASRENNFINDIVLDYVDGEIRYAYITDVGEAKLHVFDFKTQKSWSLADESMNAETDAGDIPINGVDYPFPVPIDGIAMSPDFDYVYFCPLGGFSLHQVATSSLRQGHIRGVRTVGRKFSQSDGMAFSASNKLYFGALASNAVVYWDAGRDAADQHVGHGDVTMSTQLQLAKDDDSMQWPDALSVDEEGYLWFVSNRLHLFMADKMDMSGAETNIRVWKVFTGEKSYLHGARERSRSSPAKSEL